MTMRGFLRELMSLLHKTEYPTTDLVFRSDKDVLEAEEMDLVMARQAAKEQGIGPDDPNYPKLSDVTRFSSGEDEAYGDSVMVPPRRFK